jgi:beta-N-acetylhexosaminidase
VISEFVEPANPLAEIERELKSRLLTAPKAFLFDGRATDDDAAQVMEAAKNADVVLIALAIRAKSGAGTIAIPPLARRLLDQLAATRARLVAVSFGTPYILRDVPSLPTYLAAYGIQPVLQVAAVRALFGEAAITGKLPVTIPGMYPRGHGIERAVAGNDGKR